MVYGWVAGVFSLTLRRTMHPVKLNRHLLLVMIAAMLTGCGEKQNLDTPEPYYDISYTGEAQLGDTLYFTSTAPMNKSHEWDFGNGVTSVELEPRYVFYTMPHNGTTILDDTVTLIVNHAVYRPNIKVIRLRPGISKITGNWVWKGGKVMLYGNCCPGMTAGSLNDTTFAVTAIDTFTVRAGSANLTYLADSNYYSDERHANTGHYNSTTLRYTPDTLYFTSRNGTDTGWVETTYYHKY